MKKMKLKSTVIVILMGSLFASCASRYEAIGNVSILSDRPLKKGITYKQLTTNSGGSSREIAHSKTESVEDAVKQVLAKVRGGCFITDVTIYVVNDGRYAVSGNVWGPATSDTLRYVVPNAFAGDNSTRKTQNTLSLK